MDEAIISGFIRCGMDGHHMLLSAVKSQPLFSVASYVAGFDQ